jgi:Family of unknown function (DUF5372)
LSSAPDFNPACQTFRIIHPFHPFFGREFRLVTFRLNWGEQRVYFHDDSGQLVGLPAAWTSVFPADPFVACAAGRSPFRLGDLLELSELLSRLEQGGLS